MFRQLAAVVAATLISPPLFAEELEIATQTRTMQFEQCLEVIRSTAGALGVAPLNIVETNILRMVRFCTADGSVIVTCSQLDQTMAITQSPNRDPC